MSDARGAGRADFAGNSGGGPGRRGVARRIDDSTIPRTESAAQITAVTVHIDELERMRGIRPGTVRVVPLVETPLGVVMAREIAGSSSRIQWFGVGRTLAWISTRTR